jgi:hypothetical protein
MPSVRTQIAILPAALRDHVPGRVNWDRCQRFFGTDHTY